MPREVTQPPTSLYWGAGFVELTRKPGITWAFNAAMTCLLAERGELTTGTEGRPARNEREARTDSCAKGKCHASVNPQVGNDQPHDVRST
jgi:hypothetical protein